MGWGELGFKGEGRSHMPLEKVHDHTHHPLEKVGCYISNTANMDISKLISMFSSWKIPPFFYIFFFFQHEYLKAKTQQQFGREDPKGKRSGTIGLDFGDMVSN